MAGRRTPFVLVVCDGFGLRRERDANAIALAHTPAFDRIRARYPSTEVLSRCVIDVLWMPESIVRAAGKRAALIHARDTVLRGVTSQSAKWGVENR